jgi:hypothetical protein
VIIAFPDQEDVMSEVVIAAIGRTPIGRARKGSLIDERL